MRRVQAESGADMTPISRLILLALGIVLLVIGQCLNPRSNP